MKKFNWKMLKSFFAKDQPEHVCPSNK